MKNNIKKNKRDTLFSEKEIRQLNKEGDKNELEIFFYDCLISNGKTKEYSQKISKEWSEKMTAEDEIINEVEKS